jgi:hypothetical protein
LLAGRFIDNLKGITTPDDTAPINLVLNGHSEYLAVLMDKHLALGFGWELPERESQ